MPQLSRFKINQEKTTALTGGENALHIVSGVRAALLRNGKNFAIRDIELRAKEAVEGLQPNYVLDGKNPAHAALVG